jgi:hypothetical protein
MNASQCGCKSVYNPQLIESGINKVVAGVEHDLSRSKDIDDVFNKHISNLDSFTIVSLYYLDNGYDKVNNKYLTTGAGHAVLLSSFCQLTPTSGRLGIVDPMDPSTKYNGSEVIGPVKETFGYLWFNATTQQLLFQYDQYSGGLPFKEERRARSSLLGLAQTLRLMNYVPGTPLPDINEDGYAPRPPRQSGAAPPPLLSVTLVTLLVVSIGLLAL